MVNDHEQERNKSMNKTIITLVIATLALGTFAQERDRMRRNGRGP